MILELLQQIGNKSSIEAARGFWGVRKLGGLVGLVAWGISGFLENCKGSMGNSPLPYQLTIINSMKTLYNFASVEETKAVQISQS